MNLRVVATHVISRVALQGQSLSDVLPEVLAEYKNPKDQAFIQAISYGVCRYYFRLTSIIKLLLEKPLKEKDQDIYILLLIGLFQLTEMRVPPHAAVGETVAAVKKPWAKGLVNAVLRNFQRHQSEIFAELENNVEFHYAHPRWLIEKIQHAWPHHWQQILTANNQHPPFALRVNQRRQTRSEYLAKLSCPAHIIPETEAGICLETPLPVTQLPGFLQGDISVQDGAAQLAAELLALAPHQRVLDACAAPGGKTGHILEIQPHLAEVIAIDQNSERLKLVEENLARLRVAQGVQCITADVANVKQWWDGKSFDRILLDAPCSATGVIRRHPDIKLLRRITDIAKLVSEQKRLLEAVWPLLAIDGILVYATCSILPEENEQLLAEFVAAHKEVEVEKITADWGQECQIGRQIFPDKLDGFYFARLRKKE